MPREVYTPSRRPYQGLPDLQYPFHDRDVLVTACGHLHLPKENQHLHRPRRTAARHQVDEGIWLVSLVADDLEYIDLEQRTLQPIDNPFGPRLSPVS
jgi:hypothetical protein